MKPSILAELVLVATLAANNNLDAFAQDDKLESFDYTAIDREHHSWRAYWYY